MSDDGPAWDAVALHSHVEKGKPMLFLCQFTWFPHVSRKDVAERVVRQHEAGRNKPENIKAWYNLVGGGAGFLLVDYDNPRELTGFLQPYMDVMSFDVRAITENTYDETIEDMKRILNDDEPIAL